MISVAELTVSKVCEQLDKFYIFKDDNGKFSLDPSHVYYYQVQGCMAISNVHSPISLFGLLFPLRL